jgi:phage FluMu protein Com
VALKFPKIKIINWFDIRKTEAEAQARAACGGARAASVLLL